MMNLKSTGLQKNNAGKWAVPALLFLALLLLAWPLSRITQPEASQSFADDNRKTDGVTPDLPVIQQFVPKHEKLNTIGFVLDRRGGSVARGTAVFKVYDAALQIIFEKEIALRDVGDGDYTDVPVGLTVTPGETYYFRIETKELADGAPALAYRSLSGCGPEENSLLYYGGSVIEDGSAVCRYEYGVRISPLQCLAYLSFFLFLAAAALEAGGKRFGKGEKKTGVAV